MKTVMQGNELTLFLSGDIDHHSARAIRETADGLVQEKHPHVLKLNVADVGFMDSSGIGLIMGRYRTMQLYGGMLRVTGVPDELRRIMELSGINALDVLEGGKGNEYS